MYVCMYATNMYIASARAQFKINTHRCWNWHHVHSRQVVSCPVQPRARHWSCVFWRDFSGVKRTCWTTGSWRSCLSLEVVSSIPAWSTIIYRFLCGFICVSLCQSIKIKPTNMYVCMYVCIYIYIYMHTNIIMLPCTNTEISINLGQSPLSMVNAVKYSTHWYPMNNFFRKIGFRVYIGNI